MEKNKVWVPHNERQCQSSNPISTINIVNVCFCKPQICLICAVHMCHISIIIARILTDMLKLYIFLCLDFHNCATWLRWGKDHTLASTPSFVDKIVSQKMFTHLIEKTVVLCIQMFKCDQQCSLAWQPSPLAVTTIPLSSWHESQVICMSSM